MLILTRNVGEALTIGDQVTITVLGAKGNVVRIGINAPRDMLIEREEVAESERAEVSSEKPQS